MAETLVKKQMRVVGYDLRQEAMAGWGSPAGAARTSAAGSRPRMPT